MPPKTSAAKRSFRLPTKPTAGEFLADGTLLELVRVGDAPELGLLVWDGHEARFVPSFIYGQVEYVPIMSPAPVLAAVNFPKSILDYKSPCELVDEISCLIAAAGPLSGADAERCAFFVIATWLADVLPSAPFLWLLAPSLAPRRSLVRVLQLLCRRSLRVSELTLATLQSVPAGLQPTLIVEAANTSRSRSLLKAIHASGRRGVLSLANGQMRDLCCAKIVIADQPFDRSTGTELPLEISLGLTANSATDLAEMERRGAQLQQKLLKLRLQTCAAVASSSPTCDEFATPLQSILLTLAAPVWSDEGLRSRIISLFAELDSELRAEDAVRLEALVVEALLAGCHTRGLRQLPVLEITKNVNTMREGREGGVEMTPEKIGWCLRAVGVRTVSLPDGRRGVELDDKMRQKIHALAAKLQTRSWTLRANQDNCSFCEAQLQLEGTLGRNGAVSEQRS